ncbi:hypothetical protein KR044_007407, partial [Drosophila immigrans]
LIAGLCSMPLPSSAFWWPKATTETPRSQVLQQIPLTYFRTYTYQPLAGETFGVPLFGFGAAQTPLLSGRHYDPYAVTSYAAARRHDAAHKGDVTPPATGGSSSKGGSNNVLPSTTPATTTTTTTTTTTPPPPPPTTTTTTTTTTSTTSAPPTTSTTEAATSPSAPATSSASSSSSSSALRYAEYPAYTRRVSNLYNARPQYPYPDYFNYQPQSALAEKSGTRIQFVPCMCPISMPSMPSMTSSERDRPAGVAISNPPPAPPAAAVTSSGDVAPVNLQARHMESEDSELEEEEEADADMAADPVDGDGDDAVASADTAAAVDDKVAFEAHTTPTVDSNSLV